MRIFSRNRGQAMGQNPQERDDLYAAKKVIRDAEWFLYMNPVIGVTINIPRPLIGLVMDGERDWMDACQMIAFSAKPHIQRLRPLRLGQAEILQLPPPFPSELHVLIKTEAGRDHFYINDRPFFPYR